MAVVYLAVIQIRVAMVSNLVDEVVAKDWIYPYSPSEIVSLHSVSFFQQDSNEQEVEALLLICLFGPPRFHYNFYLEFLENFYRQLGCLLTMH